MSPTYTLYPDLAAEASPPARGILSRTLSAADGIELVLFAFAAGERLAEHTSARPAILHVLEGTGDLTLAARPASRTPAPGRACRQTCRTASSPARPS
jgi:quercetin dioxygenase-like cupin family protein